MKFSDMTLQKLPIPDQGAKIYSDDTLPCFGVKVRKGGGKVFILTVGKERQRITIGRYGPGGFTLAEARRKAASILRDRELGIVYKPSPTLKDVRAEYLARREGDVRQATQRGDTYLFKLFDGLTGRRIAEITPEAIEDIITAIEAPSTRRSAYIRISGLFSYAVRRGYIDRSPVKVLDMPPDQIPRHRVLSDDELRKVLSVARVRRLAGDQYGAIVELLIYTGQRRMQIAALTREMVDFEHATITWPPELMKTDRRHTIPLGELPRTVLQQFETTCLYFPTRIGGTFTGWSHHFRKLTEEVGFRNWVLHDLRRTLATKWQEMGIEIATTEKMLSHSAVTGGLIGIYQRSNYLAQMRDAFAKWENYLHSLLFEMEDANGRGDIRDLCPA